MKILDSIQLTISRSGPMCLKCAHFENNPVVIEQAYSGLTSMSSGFASVRDKDGFCNCHQLYLSARDSCAKFETRQ